jgi:hypothetical protein
VSLSVHDQMLEEPGPLPEQGKGSLNLGLFLDRDAPGSVAVSATAFDAQGRALARQTQQQQLDLGGRTTIALLVRKTCMDACTPGAGRCVPAGRETCADHDGNGCVEFGGAQPCPQKCAGGNCVDCMDACTTGSGRCTASGALESCADHDGNGCLEFGGARACASGGCSGSACLGAFGDRCTTNAQCASNVCAGGSHCSKLCPSAADCPAGSTCVMNTAGTRLCFMNCRTNADCTRFGATYTCNTTTSVSNVTVMVCGTRAP